MQRYWQTVSLTVVCSIDLAKWISTSTHFLFAFSFFDVHLIRLDWRKSDSIHFAWLHWTFYRIICLLISRCNTTFTIIELKHTNARAFNSDTVKMLLRRKNRKIVLRSIFDWSLYTVRVMIGTCTLYIFYNEIQWNFSVSIDEFLHRFLSNSLNSMKATNISYFLLYLKWERSFL